MLLTASSMPGTYDEGLTVTGAMRVAAGQIPHRDFYAIYGPAHFYVFALLFKIFGTSLLLERIFYLVIGGLIVATVFWITSEFCGRTITAWSTITIALWFISFGGGGSAFTAASLLNLIGSVLLLPIFTRGLSKKAMMLTGAVAGSSTLFRYDTGVAMLAIQACVIGFAIYLRTDEMKNWLKDFIANFWPYAAGFSLLTVPPAIYYLSVASVHDFLHDVVIYPEKYYNRARKLPLPSINLKTIDYLVVYLPIVIALAAMYVGVTRSLAMRRRGEYKSEEFSGAMPRYGLLVSFGLFSFVMYFKGLVRISPVQMYLSILPSIVLIAVLYEYRKTFSRPLSLAFGCMFVLSLAFPALEVMRGVRTLHKQHTWASEALLDETRGTLPPALQAWCHDPNPVTKGFCFLPTIDRIDAIEFIRSHTTPDQTLYVGTFRHDKIYTNDNITYFATQRMPATHWSDFNPLLQNRADIQAKMIQELEVNKPPYVVLDSEFDDNAEPNDSSKSSGVMLLDDYIRSHYRWVQATGVMSIWQRVPGA